ncbi:hypothetical protein KXD40_005597 [Peronospora effusa]|uniref:Uncharacterized protein n=1 Tax=Peronospora effusa TaxID=542832 RepID=A0A425CCP5_9STRA|nr:hypothetical protein DD237_007254 [Peronospora effusa]UIZ27362.1 hypothetical protein KXD40_005597 [Peronospora effusa]
MFEATRALFRRRSPLTSLCDPTGKYILSCEEAGTKIKQHFQEQFSDPTRSTVADDGFKRPGQPDHRVLARMRVPPLT